MDKPRAHVAEWKKNKVAKLIADLAKYNTIAVIDMRDLPSRQLQLIRKKIKDRAVIWMTRKRLIKRAIDQLNNPKLKELTQHFQDMPALLLSNESAFDLFKILKENRSAAPAKPGQEAPEDIVVKAGPTPFAPGPIIGELGDIGIKGAIEGGKIVIKEDTVVVRAGEKISAKAAGILSRLGITPIKIGINLIAALEDDTIFTKEVLDVNVEQLVKELKEAYQNAFKLSLAQEILTKDNAQLLTQKAYLQARTLALKAKILTNETKKDLLREAASCAAKLKLKVPEISTLEKPRETLEENEVRSTDLVKEKKQIAELEQESKAIETEEGQIAEKTDVNNQSNKLKEEIESKS